MIAALAAAFCGGLIASWSVRTIARRIGFVNRPNAIVPQHRAAVAYGGGIAVLIGILAGMSVAPEGLALLVPAGLAALLGVVDDALILRPFMKLCGQVCVAASLLAVVSAPALSGIRLVDSVTAVTATLIFMNAVNLTDVCDGLAAGLGALALGVVAVAADFLPFGLAAASLLGFLILNRPPATIFLGDAGSHLVGVMLAASALMLMDQAGVAGGAVAVLATGVFLFELGFLMLVRRKKGIPVWRGSPDHFSLRLQAGPFSRWQTVLLSWAAGGAAGLAALAAHFGPAWAGPVFVAASVVLAMYLSRRLLRWEVA